MNRMIKKEIECGCDYVLPDYMGDVRKILSTRAVAIPSGKFQNDDELELTGVVEYEILYSDSDGRLTAATTAADYNLTLPVNREAYLDSLIEARALAPTIRLSGPRRMSLRSVVEVCAELSESASVGVLGDVFDGEREPEAVSRRINVETASYSDSVEREFTDIIDLDGGVAADEVEIISSSGTVRISEVIASDGGVRIKGELIINAIVKTPEQPPFAIRRAIPFDETVSVEGGLADSAVSASAQLRSLELGAQDSEGGVQASAVALLELRAAAYNDESVSVVCDAYLKDFETESEYSDLSYLNTGACQIFEHSISEKVARDSLGIADARDIISIRADVRSECVEKRDDGVTVSGEILISGVACEINADDSASFIPFKHSLPFSINVNNNCHFDDNSRISCQIHAPVCEGTLDADSLHLKITLGVRLKHNSEQKIRVLSKCTATDKEIARDGCVITVYYPSSEDTLFSVAKKYHTTAAKIAEQNSIAATAAQDSTDSLLGVKRIIIR